MISVKTAPFDAPITRAELEEATAVANEIAASVVDDIEDSGCDEAAAYFRLWVLFTRSLTLFGWEPDELAAEAARHAAQETSEGEA